MENKDPEEAFLSTIHHALRATRRRHVIQLVGTSDQPTFHVSDLAREIAAREHGLRIEHATGEPYRNTYNALSQTHLPMLEEAGILIYDPMRQTVSPGSNLTMALLIIAISRPTVDILGNIDSHNGVEPQ